MTNSYAPRLVARAEGLRQSATVLTTVLAPAYCMNYFQAEKRRMIVAWVATCLIVLAIIAFHYLPQPWRGILDAGVVVGLGWGLLATVYFALADGTARRTSGPPIA